MENIWIFDHCVKILKAMYPCVDGKDTLLLIPRPSDETVKTEVQCASHAVHHMRTIKNLIPS